MAEVYLTVHAQEAMTDRGVTFQEVEQVVRRPESQYHGHAKYGENRRIYQRGELAVVVKVSRAGNFYVQTVLWRTEAKWTSEEMKNRQ